MRDEDSLLTKKPVYDVYSLNGTGSREAKKVLSEKNIQENDLIEINKILKIVHDFFLEDESAQSLFVMDFKDFPQSHTSDSRYDNNKGCIKTGEQNFINFLKIKKEESKNIKASENAIKFKDNLSALGVGYVILEGSIKVDFIKANFLSELEKDFFQTRGGGA